jgi:competence protein ComEC
LVNTPINEYAKLDNSKLKIYGVLSDYYNAKKSADDMQGFKLSKIRYCKNNKWNKLEGAIKLNIIGKNKIFKIGDIVLINNCKMKSSVSYVNIEGFFQNKYLQSQDIYAKATSEKNEVVLLKRPKFNIRRTAYGIRYALEKSFIYVPKKERELIKAIVFGEDGLEEDLKEKFIAEGISHVMAVSGFNLAIIIMFISYLCKRLNIDYRINTLIGITAAWLFCICVGMGPSIFRAAIMTTVFSLSNYLRVNLKPLSILFYIALFMLVINPNSIYSLSFILSFGALLGILVFYKSIHRFFDFLPEIINSNLSMTLSAQILLIPIFINLFNSISIISVLTNIVIVPLAGIITVSGIITSIIGLISIKFIYLFNIANYILTKAILFIVDFTYNNFKTNIKISSVSIFICVVYYIMVVFAIYRTKINGKIKGYMAKGIITLCILIVGTYELFSYSKDIGLLKGDLKIYFIDVGQGDSILINTPHNKTILIDGGGQPSYYKNKYDIGKRVVEPFLYSKGIKKIDLLIATHSHDDHIGGLLSVIKDFDVKEVALSKYTGITQEYTKFLGLIQNKNIKTLYPKVNDKFELDGVSMRVLNPQPYNAFVNTHSDSNNDSIVLNMKYKNIKILLTGDIEAEAENLILSNENAKDLRADVLKVAHHGSRFSTSSRFLSTVKPKICVVSVGKYNNFGHPSMGTINRIKQAHCKLYRTDNDGCVTLNSDGFHFSMEKSK